MLEGREVHRHARQLLADEFGVDRVGCHAGEQGAQLFKRVGLELGEMRIHVGVECGVKSRIIPENRFAAL